MIEIRPETPDDYDAVRLVHQLAFGQAQEARLVAALRRSPAYVPELSLVAVNMAVVVGHILFPRIVIRQVSSTRDALALAPVAVLPRHQDRGIGAALIRHGLQRASELGHAIVIVVGHAEYYPRFGFTPAHPFGIRAPFEVPDDVFMALALQPHALDDAVGVVEYPPEFDSVS